MKFSCTSVTPKNFLDFQNNSRVQKNFARPIQICAAFYYQNENFLDIPNSCCKVICERQKIIQTGQIFQSETDVFLKKSKNYFCIYSIIFSIPDFCAILGRVSLSTLHSTNHALWSRCPFRFVVIEPSSLNASQPWHTLEVRIV